MPTAMRPLSHLPSRERRRLNIRHLEAFYAVSLLGSVSAAAEALNLTQPAISKQIASLETDIGYLLFRRDGGRMSMTAEARYLLEEVGDTLAHLDRLGQAVNSIRQLNTGRLEIGCPPGPSYALLPELLRDFLRERPNVTIGLHPDRSSETLRWVSLQQFDIGLIEESPAGASATISTPNYNKTSFAIDCLCALSIDNPLARRSCISLADLDMLPAVTLEPGSAMRIQQEVLFANAGHDLNLRYQVELWWAGLGLVRQNLCYALIDRINAEAFADIDQQRSVVFLPFHPGMQHYLSVITPSARPMSAIAEAFLERLLERLERLSHHVRSQAS